MFVGARTQSEQKCTGLTTRDVLGPYYKPNAPLRPSGPNLPHLCENLPNNFRIFLNGTVRMADSSGNCATGRPVRAHLDIWQANNNGEYGNTSPSSPNYVSVVLQVTSNQGKVEIALFYSEF